MKADPNASTPAQYIASVPVDRRPAIRKLHRLIRKTAPALKAHIQYGMLGYGPVKYRTKSGCEGDWFVIGLANQKNYLSLYFCVSEGGKYLAEVYTKDLGKVNCGKSCVRFRKLEDLNLETVEQMIRKAQALHQDGNFCQ